MEATSIKPLKFETLCGRTFESSASLASFLGVTKGAISHAKIEAREKGRNYFECGKPMKRFIRILSTGDQAIRSPDVSKLFVDKADDASKSLPDNSRLLHASMVGFKLMKSLQVQGFMQAAALKLFPDKNLRMLKNTEEHISVAVIATEDASYTMFDVAEMWWLYSRISAPSLEEFRQALLGDGAYGLQHDITVLEYPSLMFAASPGAPAHASFRMFMLPEDVIKFLLSPFARKAHYDPLFDSEMQAPEMQKDAISGENADGQTTDMKKASNKQNSTQDLHPPSYEECTSLACQATAGVSTEDVFVRTCQHVMQDVISALGKRREMESYPAASMEKQKRQLAAAAVQNMTTVLFAANTLLYSEAQKL